jgi:hypothetical protein
MQQLMNFVTTGSLYRGSGMTGRFSGDLRLAILHSLRGC